MSQVSNEIKQFFNGKTFTFQGRIFFPKLVTPEMNQSGTRSNYSVCVAFFGNPQQIPQGLSPEEQKFAMESAQKNVNSLQMLNAFMQEAKQKFWPQFPMQAFVNPLKHFDTYVRQDGRPNHDFMRGMYWINATSGEKFKPAVVDTAKQEVLDPSLIYSGANAVMNIGLYPITNNKTGISANINAVMLLGGGSVEGGAGAVDVNTVFGDFANDMGVAQGQPNQQLNQAFNQGQGQNTLQGAQGFQQQQQAQQNTQQQQAQQGQQFYDPSQQQQQQAGQYNPNNGNGNGNGFV